ncbi:MAG: DUF2804 domain-containing protein [Candidatus Geothermincolia bacterium]
MELKRTPDNMVSGGRLVECGAFRSPFEKVNFSEARISVAGMRMPGAYSRFRLKEWQHFGIIAEGFYFMFAIFNARYLADSFCYFLDRVDGTRVEYEKLAPPGTAKVPSELWHDECGFSSRGYEIKIENRLADGCHRAKIEIAASSGKPAVSAEVEVIEDLAKTQPLELISLLKGGRPAYTHKVPCPARAEVVVGGKNYSVGTDEGIALIDISKAFFPYTSFWYWATCAGHDAEGRLVALNLGKGINIRGEEFNDNCLWVDGRISFLGLPRFEFDEKALLKPWHIETSGGSCVLDFEPRGERRGKVNALVVKSDFHQPYGVFNGTATDSDGCVHEIDDYFGVVEHHVARY